MNKTLKEFIMIILAGAGILYVIWGSFATRTIGAVTLREPDWKAIGIGGGLIVVSVALGLLVRAKAPRTTS